MAYPLGILEDFSLLPRSAYPVLAPIPEGAKLRENQLSSFYPQPLLMLNLQSPLGEHLLSLCDLVPASPPTHLPLSYSASTIQRR